MPVGRISLPSRGKLPRREIPGKKRDALKIAAVLDPPLDWGEEAVPDAPIPPVGMPSTGQKAGGSLGSLRSDGGRGVLGRTGPAPSRELWASQASATQMTVAPSPPAGKMTFGRENPALAQLAWKAAKSVIAPVKISLVLTLIIAALVHLEVHRPGRSRPSLYICRRGPIPDRHPVVILYRRYGRGGRPASSRKKPVDLPIWPDRNPRKRLVNTLRLGKTGKFGKLRKGAIRLRHNAIGTGANPPQSG